MIGLLLISALSTAQSAEVKIDWKRDSLVTIAALGTYGLLEIQKPRDMTSRASPTGIDAWTKPQWNPAYSDISDFLGHPLTLYGMNLPVLSTIGLSAYAAQKKGTLNGLAHGMIVLQATAINGVVTKALKLSISRPRPFTSESFQATYPEAYDGRHIKGKIDGGDAFQSMPSGHTSTAATVYFSMATLLAAQSDDTWRNGGLYGAACLLTAATAAARIKYGMHHPTDTIVGGLLGAGIGYGVSRLHIVHTQQISLQNKQGGVQIGFGGLW